MNSTKPISTGSYPATSISDFYTLVLSEGKYVLLDVSNDNGTSSIYDEFAQLVGSTTAGTPKYLSAGTYTVQANYSTTTFGVTNAYIPSEAAFASLPALASGPYKAASYDNFYALTLTAPGDLWLVVTGDSARGVVYDTDLNFVAYTQGGPMSLPAGQYVVHTSFSGLKNGALTANIPVSMLNGSPAQSTASPLEADNVFAGSTYGPDVISGMSGDDRFIGYGGVDFFNGGVGLDSSTYFGDRAEYSISFGSALDPRTVAASTIKGRVVTDSLNGRDGQDVLQHVERLHFKDVSVALDIDGVAGQAYRIYNAAFNRTPDLTGVGFWMKAMDRGMTLGAVAEQFASSAEFSSLYGVTPSNADFLTKLYMNILDRAPEEGGFAFWLNVLDNKLASVAEVLAEFAESAENRDAVATIIGEGFEFVPFGS